MLNSSKDIYEDSRVLVGCLICLFLISGCKIKNPFEGKVPDINPCDPVVNMYIDEKHYIERDYVTDSGNIDYKRWFEARKVQASPCDPVSRTKRKN